MNQQNNGNLHPSVKTRISTRSRNGLLANITNKQLSKKSGEMPKRKAEESPLKGKHVKAMRAAFGDLTNNTVSKSTISNDAKKSNTLQSKTNQFSTRTQITEKQASKITVKPKDIIINKNPTGTCKVMTVKPAKPDVLVKSVKTLPVTGVQTRRSFRSKEVPQTNENNKQDKINVKKTASVSTKANIAPRKTFTHFGKVSIPPTSNANPKEVTLVKYKTTNDLTEGTCPPALGSVQTKPIEVMLSSDSSSSSSGSTSSPDSSLVNESKVEEGTPDEEKTTIESVKSVELREPEVPLGIDDFDQETMSDPFQVAIYAMDIFNYLREREATFLISDYMPKQVCLSKEMRALLVDWMVEIQETFELNHETLYLAVKLVDLYLSKVMVSKEMMQLIGAASIFVASKYDERTPPLIDDFLYVCNGAYSHEEIIKAEMNVVKVVNYDLGIPLSYRFLRRYARCAKVSMPILTLARYILEFSLMDYSFIFYSDSKLAASALYLALQMKNIGGWTVALEYYTSHKLAEIKDIVLQLNAMLHKKHPDNLKTVKNKYSHRIFFEVAKTPLLKKVDL